MTWFGIWDGIRVNAVAPGDILTDTSAGIVGDLTAAGAALRSERADELIE
jgi:NAD(P)-dependent dehydrogenase (short-subunit alcohol dehydrogenase family)